jgi:site-specific DNA-cytosine methylase
LRLQGFPTNFVLSGSVVKQWHQLGNTIPTVFTDMIAQNIRRAESPPAGAQTPA